MEQRTDRINLYRFHTGACIHGYRKPWHEGEKKLPDCTCPIVGEGRLRNELDEKTGKPARILHRSLGKKGNPVRDWDEARAIRELWLGWGRTTEPGSGFEHRADITIEEAVKFFFDYQEQTATAGKQTKEKYRVLLGEPINPDQPNGARYLGRLQGWCKLKDIRFIKAFDSASIVSSFFMSWKNLRQPLMPLAPRTKQAERDRYKAFLERCKKHGWITQNHAEDIKLGRAVIAQKVAWTVKEHARLMDAFEMWTDEYGRIDTPKSKMVTAFATCLGEVGQRLSDTAMLGPSNIVEENGKFFIELTQLKTGQSPKIGVEKELVDMLRALPFRGVLDKPFVVKRKGWTITYPAQGYWFWTGVADLENNSNSWSMDIARVIARCEEESGKFANHSTPHTFRHYFAIQCLTNGATMEQVARWLGDSEKTVRKHYSNANADYHDEAHATMMKIKARMKGTPKASGKVIRIRKAS